MGRFIEGHLALTGRPPIGVNPVYMTYGPRGSGRDIIQEHFPNASGTVHGRFSVSEEAVYDAQKEYDAFFRGPFGVIAGILSTEAGWYDGPAASQHKRFEGAVKSYRRLRPRLPRRFIAGMQKIAHGIREGWFVPTHTHHLVLAIVRPGVDDTTDVVASLTMTWEPEDSGPGSVTDFDFEPEWTDYFSE